MKIMKSLYVLFYILSIVYLMISVRFEYVCANFLACIMYTFRKYFKMSLLCSDSYFQNSNNNLNNL